MANAPPTIIDAGAIPASMRNVRKIPTFERRPPVVHNYSSTSEKITVEETVEEVPPPKKSKTGLIIVIVVVVLIVLIAIGVGVYLFLKSRNSNNNNAPIVATLGQSCVTLPCVNPLTCSSSVCKSHLDGPCFGNDDCVPPLICDTGSCKVGLFGPCTANADCATGLICNGSDVCVNGP
jgi:hypothetical protein